MALRGERDAHLSDGRRQASDDLPVWAGRRTQLDEGMHELGRRGAVTPVKRFAGPGNQRL